MTTPINQSELEKAILNGAYSLKWAIDLIKQYDAFLVTKGEPMEMVYSEAHKQGIVYGEQNIEGLFAAAKSHLATLSIAKELVKACITASQYDVSLPSYVITELNTALTHAKEGGVE